MQREILNYIEYLKTFKEVNKPIMPNFDISAYTDIEYIKMISELQKDFDNFEDLEVYLQFLKGD